MRCKQLEESLCEMVASRSSVEDALAGARAQVLEEARQCQDTAQFREHLEANLRCAKVEVEEYQASNLIQQRGEREAVAQSQEAVRRACESDKVRDELQTKLQHT